MASAFRYIGGRFRAAAVLVLVLLVAPPAWAAHYDVYLLAGQSNMDGRGPVRDLVGPLAEYAGVQPGAWIWYSNGTFRRYDGRSKGWEPLRPGFSVPPGELPTSAPAATGPAATQPATARSAATRAVRERYPLPGPVFGPEIGFAKAVMDARPEGPALALLKFSVSGANLRHEWNPDRRGQIYDAFLDSAHDALSALTARGDTYTIKALLWHQGESDASLSAAEYEKLLRALIAHVRQDFAAPTLPVILGEPYDNGHRLGIREAQRNVARSLPDVFWVSAVGLSTLDHGTHFDAASQIELGRRFAEAALNRRDAGPVPPPATQPTTAPAGEDPS